MFRKLISTENDAATAILRLALGVVFFAHGAQKMLGWFGGDGFNGTMGFFTKTMHIPALFAILAIAAEFFGGLGLIVGLLSRVAALGIALNMLVAIAMVHYQFGFFMNWFGTQKGEGYEYHVLAVGMAVLVTVRGAGRRLPRQGIDGGPDSIGAPGHEPHPLPVQSRGQEERRRESPLNDPWVYSVPSEAGRGPLRSGALYELPPRTLPVTLPWHRCCCVLA